MKTSKYIYWLVENNSGLRDVVEDIKDAELLIRKSFERESENGLYDIEDVQYTVKPIMLTDMAFKVFKNNPDESR